MLDALTVPTFARVTDYCGVWAIESSAGAVLWSLARRTNLPAHVAAATPPQLAAAADYEVARVGPPANPTKVAIVPVVGMLMKSVSSMSSATSTVATRRAVRKAAADPDIGAILLAVDSPGGTVSGTADLAADVKAAAKQKPVWAFAEDLCASAAYWVASQADRVFANTATALVGSIGTLVVVYDMSGAAEKEGIKALVFGTGPIKGAGTPGAPVTEEQQAYFRALVEGSQKSFDAAVQKSRGLTDKQLAGAKTGGVFGAVEALERKLIDGVQSFDKTLADLSAEVRRRSGGGTTRADAPVPRSVVAPVVAAPVVEAPPLTPAVFAPVAGPVAFDARAHVVALHEAAHACVARALGLGVLSLVVQADGSGTCTLEHEHRAPHLGAVAAAAGPVFDRLFGRVPHAAGPQDPWAVRSYSADYERTTQRPMPFDPYQRAEELLGRPGVVAAVNRVARAVRIGAPMSGDQIEALITTSAPEPAPARRKAFTWEWVPG